MEEMELIGRRFLETEEEEEEDEYESFSFIIKHSLRVYGSLFAVGFVVYCIVRKNFPRVFAVRQWATNCKHPLANEQFGYVSWIWKIFSYEQDVLLEAIGLDGVCFLRVMNMGFRLAGVGCFNSIWLFAVYATAPMDPDDPDQEDALENAAINSLQPGSIRFLAPVLAAYIFFGYTFYTILKEFKWFITQRHLWLQKFNQRNYTILVRGIPKELRSDKLLLEHFQMLYRPERVLEAHVVLHITNLESRVAKRKACVANLEHALAELAIKGERPKHTLLKESVENAFTVQPVGPGKYGKTEVDSIEYYTEEVNDMNRDINEKINQIEKKKRPNMLRQQGAYGKVGGVSSLGMESFSQSDRLLTSVRNDDAVENMEEIVEHEALDISNESSTTRSSKKRSLKTAVSHTSSKAKHIVSDTASTAKFAGKTLIKKTVKNTKKRAKQARNTVSAAKDAASSMLGGEEDGKADDAAFVTFRSLVAVYAALQMSQHSEPFVFETEACPDLPINIFWKNVGKDKEVRQTGFLISTAATIALCLFWTIPVSFITNLTSTDFLTSRYPGLEETLEENPGIERILTLISPLLLLVFNSGILPVILKYGTLLFEFPASDALLEASVFWKMAAFTIIQTFFVTLLSGTIFEELESILENPQNFIKFLAVELPKQSAYFIQLLIVSTCAGTLVELFRVVPVFQWFARSFIGRRLTEKERNQKCGPLHPLSLVYKFYFSRVQARFLLYFMVLFVYSTISPLVNWFCLFFFLLLKSVYLHQFLFNFPNIPDTGGEIWLYFMHVLLICVVIAQLTLMGFLTLKEFAISIPLMVPLLVITGIFIFYLNQRHFAIGKYLAARPSLSQDLKNEEEGVDYTVFKNCYQNPALTERIVDVDWDSGKNEVRKGSIELTDDVENRPEEEMLTLRATNTSAHAQHIETFDDSAPGSVEGKDTEDDQSNEKDVGDSLAASKDARTIIVGDFLVDVCEEEAERKEVLFAAENGNSAEEKDSEDERSNENDAEESVVDSSEDEETEKKKGLLGWFLKS